MALPVDRFLNAVYVWAMRRVDPEKFDQWKFLLEQPFPKQVVTQATVEQEMEQFAAFAGAFGVRGPQPG